MVTFIATIIIVILALIAFSLGLLLSLPKELRVTQSQVLQHPQKRIAEMVSNLNLWHKWNPWLLHDPESDRSNESEHSWNSQFFGKGRIDAKNGVQNNKLHFAAEFKGIQSKVEIDWDGNDSTTEITWRIHSALPWYRRWQQFRLQHLLKQDLQLGLFLLDNLLEESPEIFRIEFGNRVERSEALGISQHFFGSFDELSDYASEAFDKLFGELKEQQQASAPLTAYHKVDLTSMTTECEFFIPVNDVAEGQISSRLPGGTYYRIDYFGAYRHLELVWNQSIQHLLSIGLRIDRNRPYLEEYLTNPQDGAEDAMHTVLYLPIK
ncbi:effector binding domain-containing protein [Thiomicrorhabdus sp.]|uniref:effector binding domain-containing protein n=1 Tax=Thiomicrorhabdus sp. TaxID=2039724 RepID=UPI0029C8B3B6|nr:effector binding domain-containing protein [Thiomicrorhabdus sp.]